MSRKIHANMQKMTPITKRNYLLFLTSWIQNNSLGVVKSTDQGSSPSTSFTSLHPKYFNMIVTTVCPVEVPMDPVKRQSINRFDATRHQNFSYHGT